MAQFRIKSFPTHFCVLSRDGWHETTGLHKHVQYICILTLQSDMLLHLYPVTPFFFFCFNSDEDHSHWERCKPAYHKWKGCCNPASGGSNTLKKREAAPRCWKGKPKEFLCLLWRVTMRIPFSLAQIWGRFGPCAQKSALSQP